MPGAYYICIESYPFTRGCVPSFRYPFLKTATIRIQLAG